MSNKNTQSKSRELNPRKNFQQKKLRRQQIFMTIVAIILVVSMVLALAMNY